MKNLLLTLLALAMLAGFALAVPGGYIAETAQEAYTETFGDEEYDFL